MAFRFQVEGLNNIEALIGAVLLQEKMTRPDWNGEKWSSEMEQREAMIRSICLEQFGRTWLNP
jgi:hypothetical protein